MGAGRPRSVGGAGAPADTCRRASQRRTLALRLHLKAARQERRPARRCRPRACWRSIAPFPEPAAPKHRARIGDRTALRARTTRLSWSVPGTTSKPVERQMPEVAIQAAQRMVALHGDLAVARGWLLPIVGVDGRAGPTGLGGSLAGEAGPGPRGRARIGRRRLAGRASRRRSAATRVMPICSTWRAWGVHETPALGQGPATAHAGRPGPAGCVLAPAGVASACPARRGAATMRHRRMAAWKRAAQADDRV